MIAPQTLLVASFLSVTWGIYLLGTIRMYQQTKARPGRVRADVVIAMRRVIVALCCWVFVFSFVFRSAAVLLGLGDEVIGHIVFFSLVGVNLTGSIFAVVSLRYD